MKSRVDAAAARVTGIAGESGPAIADGLPWRELQHPKPLNNANVGLPPDVERDLARIVARALVQQFRKDEALSVESGNSPYAAQVNGIHARRVDR